MPRKCDRSRDRVAKQRQRRADQVAELARQREAEARQREEITIAQGVNRRRTADHRRAWSSHSSQGGQSARRTKRAARSCGSQGGGPGRPPLTGGSVYSRQIFQITPVPGIWTSGASAATLNLLAGSDWPKSRTAP